MSVLYNTHTHVHTTINVSWIFWQINDDDDDINHFLPHQMHHMLVDAFYPTAGYYSDYLYLDNRCIFIEQWSGYTNCWIGWIDSIGADSAH